MENEPFEDVFPIKHGDIPASYVSLPEGNLLRFFLYSGMIELGKASFSGCEVSTCYFATVLPLTFVYS